MQNHQILGLDVGQKRTGIARGSSAARLAEPLMTVDTKDVFETLKKLIVELDVKTIVIGLPRNLNGQDTPQTEWIRHWTENAKTILGGTFYWQDEALTTETAKSGKPSSKGVDADAAAIILQDFLNSAEEERVKS